MEPPELREDLKQEVFLAICELSDERFNEIQNLRHFVVRIIINQIQSSNSPFYTKYRKLIFQPLAEELEIVDHTDHEEKESRMSHCEAYMDLMKSSGNSSDYYNANILEQYLKVGSTRKLSKKTKIPFTSIARTVKETREYIKKQYQERA